jgi:regulator of sigma E protease
VLYTVEAVRGRPLGERTQEMAFRFGLAMVLSLMLFATWNDRTVVYDIVNFLSSLAS